MHCFKDNINNRKYILQFIRLLLPPKSPILPNLGGYRTYMYMYVVLYTCTPVYPYFYSTVHVPVHTRVLASVCVPV